MPSDKSLIEAELGINQALARIQVCLAAEDWPGVESVVSRLPGLVESVPSADSADLIQAIRNSLDTVRIHVEERSNAIGSQLTALKQGRIATRAYLASGHLSQDA